ncbi:ermin [Mixophyes fleayi]|uniref:ermin n=1 Tax=Mixophyes fleayi TaxID=3061075 RepID=UPI003F4DCFC8
MSEETEIPEHNGNAQPEIIPVQITDIIDQMDTSVVCKTRDPVFTSKITEGTGIHLADKVVTPILDINQETIEEEQKGETDPASTSQTGSDAQKGECELIRETEVDSAPACTFPGKEDLDEPSGDHEGVKTETPDILLHSQRKHLDETSPEDTLTETEEENTSIETDNENGEGSHDEQEYGFRSVSPGGGHLGSNEEQSGNKPDISRHSYSRYDTVSYRKIRKGNTKQRIDEFESMMNL